MELLSKILIGLVVVIHFYILWFEMFAWEKKGPKVFKSFPKELFPKTTEMAANQGLYNGFLATGLLWTFFIDSTVWHDLIAIFFLVCVMVAGIYGALVVETRILYVQTIPALIALIFLFLS